MPRIRDEFLDCVLYLYPSFKHADDAADIGGTGFIMTVPTEGLQKNFLFPYVVTNRHVIEAGNTVLRMTARDGRKQVLETDDRDWHFHPRGDDLAVYLTSIDPSALRFSHLLARDIMLKHDLMTHAVGIGDDVFVVGRFINHDGKQRNSPTARFGCIAQMPNEPVKIGEIHQECYLVEARSIGGLSGSPVFWHVRPFAGGAYRPSANWQIGPLLLGVEVGYIQDWTPVCDAVGRPINFAEPRAQQVKVNSGMMAVVPGWKLAELLNAVPVLEQRRLIEAQVRALEGETGGEQLPRDNEHPP